MLKPLLVCLLGLSLLACTKPERALVPGQSTMSELVRELGQPSKIWSEGDGSLLVEFARVSEGGSNLMARVGRDGVVMSLQETLTEARIRALEIGMTRDEVRRQLGQPSMVANTETAEVWYWPLEQARAPRWQIEAHFGARGKLSLVDRTPIAPGVARSRPAGQRPASPL